ncbi:MAG: hypothetical protein K9K66_01720 [Desulfarculaceae bacterium]|nr:hypothetical protein [Desulfarculaceae bacterium]MCF8073500.1 hypothetical protein [Desulfarculaceae bacterium]MCF8100353.1 hypothetical protein [Desulfarculaceae bacterium]MCF8117532.1 hypothetical protein [Desulfarculaceae bacterium]
MVRKLALIMLLMFLAAALVPLAAHAGRIGYKNETKANCYVFKWQTLLWAKSESKWIPDGPPKTRSVKPGATYIYEGLVDGIEYVEAQKFGDADCSGSSGGFQRVWHNSAPAATNTLNVMVDKGNNVTVKQIR